jgi:hypothetical protein
MGRRMQTICDCISEASRQARDADIDVPSKRIFHLMYASRDASSASPMDAGTGLYEGMARTRIGMKTFLDCLNDAKTRVRQGRTDDLTRKFYRRLPE